MSKRKRSIKQEEKLASAFGGRRQPASGALWYAKDDVVAQGKYRIEAKYTDSGKYRLKASEFKTLKKRAYAAGEVPVFVIEFSPEKQTVCFVPPNTFDEREHLVPICWRYTDSKSLLVHASMVLDHAREEAAEGKRYKWELSIDGVELEVLTLKVLLEIINELDSEN